MSNLKKTVLPQTVLFNTCQISVVRRVQRLQHVAIAEVGAEVAGTKPA